MGILHLKNSKVFVLFLLCCGFSFLHSPSNSMANAITFSSLVCHFVLLCFDSQSISFQHFACNFNFLYCLLLIHVFLASQHAEIFACMK